MNNIWHAIASPTGNPDYDFPATAAAAIVKFFLDQTLD